MKIGVQELLLIFIVALIVLGPDKLPIYARKFGEALREFRKFSSDATKDIRESIVEPLEEAQRPLREALEPITELEKDVRNDVKDIKKSFEDIGKPVKLAKAAEGESADSQTVSTDEKTEETKEQISDAEDANTFEKTAMESDTQVFEEASKDNTFNQEQCEETRLAEDTGTDAIGIGDAFEAT